MFFELATFILALNKDINTSLVTHLIVDMESSHQRHFFNLFLLYVKENFASQLGHMRLILFASDANHAHSLQKYFSPEDGENEGLTVKLIDFNALFGSSKGSTLEGVKITHLYLDDIANFGNSLVNPKMSGSLEKIGDGKDFGSTFLKLILPLFNSRAQRGNGTPDVRHSRWQD